MKYPSKSHRKYTDEDVLRSARQYKTRGDWKKFSNREYQIAHLRGGELLEQCCAHMVRPANPYAGDYVIYAYEFEDRHVYIGLTFLPTQRKSMHAVRGPVSDHAKICPNYTYRQIETGLPSPEEAAKAEQRHIECYKSSGWTVLNKNKGGGLGTLQREWTKEAVLSEALKFPTKQEWIDGSQMSYRIAKREGWFDEASAHMPKRKLGVGAGRVVSKQTREKQRAAKLGKNLSKAHRDKISRSVKAVWLDK
jgi:hypothetical protein